jgi:hypothetical protein
MKWARSGSGETAEQGCNHDLDDLDTDIAEADPRLA